MVANVALVGVPVRRRDCRLRGCRREALQRRCPDGLASRCGSQRSRFCRCRGGDRRGLAGTGLGRTSPGGMAGELRGVTGQVVRLAPCGCLAAGGLLDRGDGGFHDRVPLDIGWDDAQRRDRHLGPGLWSQLHRRALQGVAQDHVRRYRGDQPTRCARPDQDVDDLSPQPVAHDQAGPGEHQQKGRKRPSVFSSHHGIPRSAVSRKL